MQHENHPLAGRVALITGASRGIGAATATACNAAGMPVALVARSTAEIEALASQINDAGGRALAIAADVSRYDAVHSAIERCRESLGGLDILVNNAGLIDPIARLADSDPDGWDTIIDVNVKGVYHGIRACLPSMVAQGGGTIVNISSGAASNPIEGWSHYCASKAAVLALTRCTHTEYAESGICCVGLSPGTVATAMQERIRESGINDVSQLDWSRHIPPEWVAKAIVWLCTDAAHEFMGDDFSIKTRVGRRLVGLPEEGAA